MVNDFIDITALGDEYRTYINGTNETEYISLPEEDICQTICHNEFEQEFIKAKEFTV